MFTVIYSLTAPVLIPWIDLFSAAAGIAGRMNAFGQNCSRLFERRANCCANGRKYLPFDVSALWGKPRHPSLGFTSASARLCHEHTVRISS